MDNWNIFQQHNWHKRGRGGTYTTTSSFQDQKTTTLRFQDQKATTSRFQEQKATTSRFQDQKATTSRLQDHKTTTSRNGDKQATTSWFQGVFSEDKKPRHWDSQTKKSRHRNSKTKKPRHRVPVEFWPLYPLVIYRGQCALGRRYRFLNSVSNYIMWPLIWKLMLHWFQKCNLIYTKLYTIFKLCQHFKYWAKNNSPKENYALGFGLQTRLSLKLFNSLQKWKKDIIWLKKTSFSFCYFFLISEYYKGLM